MTKFTGKYADEKWKEGFSKMMEIRQNQTFCISERACDKCDAIHYDSICLCIGAFVCSECGFDNGEKYRNMYKSFDNIKSSTLPLSLFKDTNG